MPEKCAFSARASPSKLVILAPKAPWAGQQKWIKTMAKRGPYGNICQPEVRGEGGRLLTPRHATDFTHKIPQTMNNYTPDLLQTLEIFSQKKPHYEAKLCTG